MVQLVDAAKNADDRMSGNVPRFSRTRFGICIGVGIGPGVVLRRLAVASSTKHYTIQRSHNTATTSIVLSGCPRACAASVLELELYIPKMAAHRLSPGRLQLFVLLKLCEKFLDYDASNTAVAAPFGCETGPAALPALDRRYTVLTRVREKARLAPSVPPPPPRHGASASPLERRLSDRKRSNTSHNSR
jgi:hypothetical protein